jgi:hypothetical protein
MTLIIEVDQTTETQLVEKARQKGMELERYAASVLQAATAEKPNLEPRPSQDEFRAFLDAMASHAPSAVGFDDQNWSRAMIYGEHD